MSMFLPQLTIHQLSARALSLLALQLTITSIWTAHIMDAPLAVLIDWDVLLL